MQDRLRDGSSRALRTRLYARLVAIARRHVGPMLAEDVVQEALLIAVEAGRHDILEPLTARWLGGVTRNRARMAARGMRRGRERDAAWASLRHEPAPVSQPLPDLLAGLPPALRAVAALVLTGHDRREIAYLLGLPDTALRQRIAALRRRLATRGLAAPTEPHGLSLDLAYGRIRAALRPALLRHDGFLATHDPDGHLFVIRRSQTASARQQAGISNKGSSR